MVRYKKPNFNRENFNQAPDIKLEKVLKDGVMPHNFYSTTNHPTYVKHDNNWHLVREQRMDSCITFKDGEFFVREFRNINTGDLIAVGKKEDGSHGLYVHETGFDESVEGEEGYSKFEFMSSAVSRENPIIYEKLVNMLREHKENGYIVWVLGPAVAHSRGRKDMAWIIDNKYINILFAGNALAVHDLEASVMGTTLGMNSQGFPVPGGHRHHMDTINKIRFMGSIQQAVEQNIVSDGIMYSCVKNNLPYILAGSIRDDGPLPEVITNALEAQDIMRSHTKKATLVVMLATTLHSIATGNMLPTFYERGGEIMPLATICVDQDEFVVNKLKDRGTHQAFGVVTNAQDFLHIIVNELKNK